MSEEVKYRRMDEWTTLDKGKRYVARVGEREYPEDQKLVKFTVAKELAYVSNKTTRGDEQSRYSILEAVETTKGKIVYANKYITHWQGEQGYYIIDVFGSKHELAEHIKSQEIVSELELKFLEDLGVLDTIAEEI